MVGVRKAVVEAPILPIALALFPHDFHARPQNPSWIFKGGVCIGMYWP
jgi:hypothetical protein